MTEQRQIEIRADLARAMGWTHVISGAVGFCPEVSRQLAYCHDAFKKYICGHIKRPIPDPFTDAADNRALVAWLAGQDATVWGEFSGMVIDSGIPFEQQAYADWEMVTRAFALAPLGIIAIAAAKALGIETE